MHDPTFTKLADGSWGVRVPQSQVEHAQDWDAPDPMIGRKVIVKRRDGECVPTILASRVGELHGDPVYRKHYQCPICRRRHDDLQDPALPGFCRDCCKMTYDLDEQIRQHGYETVLK